MNKFPKIFQKKLWRISSIVKIAIITGITIYVLAFLTFHVEVPSIETVDFSEPYIQYPSPEEKKINQLIREQAELYDSAPLFLPTSWNYVTNVETLSLEVHSSSLFPTY